MPPRTKLTAKKSTGGTISRATLLANAAEAKTHSEYMRPKADAATKRSLSKSDKSLLMQHGIMPWKADAEDLQFLDAVKAHYEANPLPASNTTTASVKNTNAPGGTFFTKGDAAKAPMNENNHDDYNDYDEQDDLESMPYGFFQCEVDELLCHGLKPWDDDARDFLDALHTEYDKIDNGY